MSWNYEWKNNFAYLSSTANVNYWKTHSTTILFRVIILASRLKLNIFLFKMKKSFVII